MEFFKLRFFLVIFFLVLQSCTVNSVKQNQNGNNGHPVYQFSARLLNQVALEKGREGSSHNILISPFSIRTALAIMSLGSKGTQKIIFMTNA